MSTNYIPEKRWHGRQGQPCSRRQMQLSFKEKKNLGTIKVKSVRKSGERLSAKYWII